MRKEETLDEALLLMKRAQPPAGKESPWRALRQTLEAEVAKARQRRIHHWQTDSRHRTLRLRMEILHPACLLHPSGLQAAMARTLFEAGLPLAMGLEKTPRPMLHLGQPLPAGVDGLGEWLDAVLREPAPLPVNELPGAIQPHCPEGIRILEAREIPNISSPVLELCHRAHWRWHCPEEMRALAMERMRGFEAASSFTIQKSGKVDGHKQIKHVEVRHLIHAMAWKDGDLLFSTGIAPGEATNPVKVLAGILEIEPAAIAGMARLGVDLAEDPRLAQAHKYETKLHNIYEDAVLLDGGVGLSPADEKADEEDEEPLIVPPRDARGGPGKKG